MDAHTFWHRLVGDGEVEIGFTRLRDLAAGSRPHDEDAHAGELAPEDERLPDGRDAERQRPLAERRTCDVDRAVPVAVGLDDHPELGSPECTAKATHVSPQGAQVDGDLRAVHRA